VKIAAKNVEYSDETEKYRRFLSLNKINVVKRWFLCMVTKALKVLLFAAINLTFIVLLLNSGGLHIQAHLLYSILKDQCDK